MMAALRIFTRCECTFYTLAHSQVLARKRATETRPPCLDRISSSLIVRGPFPCPFINSWFRHAVRCSCSSVPDGQTWSIPTECVNLSSLSTSVAGAKSLQMPHRFPLFSASHFSASFFPLLLLLLVFFYSLATLVCIIIICPERALSERGLFVLQPGTRLFSGSAVFFPSPSVPSQYPGEICFCL